MWRSFLRRIHPEGIPWPASLVYNAISRSRVFQDHYRLVATDVASFCADGRVLDVGTGPGWLLARLHERCPHLRLAAVDISPAMVSKAAANLRRAGLADADIRVAAAERLPFEDGSFDAVVSTGSLHHWRDPAGGLAEAHRVLKPGGRGLIYDIVMDTPREVLDQLTRDYGRFRATLLKLHSLEEPFHTTGELGSLAAGTPFEGGQVRFVGALACLVLRKAGG